MKLYSIYLNRLVTWEVTEAYGGGFTFIPDDKAHNAFWSSSVPPMASEPAEAWRIEIAAIDGAIQKVHTTIYQAQARLKLLQEQYNEALRNAVSSGPVGEPAAD